MIQPKIKFGDITITAYPTKNRLAYIDWIIEITFQNGKVISDLLYGDKQHEWVEKLSEVLGQHVTRVQCCEVILEPEGVAKYFISQLELRARYFNREQVFTKIK